MLSPLKRSGLDTDLGQTKLIISCYYGKVIHLKIQLLKKLQKSLRIDECKFILIF